MGGIRGSCIGSSVNDVLEMSMVLGAAWVGLYQSYGNMGSVGRVSRLRWCSWYWGDWVWCFGQGLGGWCCVMSMYVGSLDSLYRWQVHVSILD